MATLGIVLVHGKWERPPYALAPLAARLEADGHRVLSPAMPWALPRPYEQPLAAAFDAIGGAIDALRAAGCARIALGGHSLGASAALAWAAQRGRPDALLVLAPGHFPERLHADGFTASSVAAARAALAAGQHGRLTLADAFQGRARRLRLLPAPYLDYFAPDGALQLPRNCAALRTPVPLLWVVGTRDANAALGPDYAYAHAPAHAASRYLQIDADHVSIPAAAASDAAAWLATLFAEAAQPCH